MGAPEHAVAEHPAYETPRPATRLATVVLCDNPGEMTIEGTNGLVLRVPGSDRSVLVDPGPHDPRHQAALAAAGGEQVELVLVTHRHPDHTGGIDELHRVTGAPVRAPLAEHCRAGEPLVDGEVVHAAGLELTVVATPGHTADSVCVLVRQAGEDADGGVWPLDSIVLGDTILGHPSTVLDSTDGDLGDYLGSLATLERLGAGVTGLPGHGPEVVDVAADARRLAEHRRSRLEQVRAARAELGPDATVQQLTAHIYTELTPFLLRVAEQSTAVAVRYLDREAGPRP